MFLPDSQSKSWFWKFRRILHKLEEFFFTDHADQENSERIFLYYIKMRDLHRAGQLMSKFDLKIDISKCEIMISLARDCEEIGVDLLMSYEQKLKEVSINSPWVVALREGVGIMI